MDELGEMTGSPEGKTTRGHDGNRHDTFLEHLILLMEYSVTYVSDK